MNESKTREHRKADQAERAVLESMNTFEKAMDELAGAVEEAGEIVQNLVGFARLPKEELRRFKDRVKYVIEDIKANPQPYALATGGAVGLVLFRVWRRRHLARPPRFSADASY